MGGLEKKMGIFGNNNTEQEDEESETYSYELNCNNCGSSESFDIKRGTLVEKYLKETQDECAECGCVDWADPHDSESEE